MQAAQFYQVSQQGACVIKLMNQTDWKEMLRDKRCPAGGVAQNFSGKLGEIFYENDQSGSLKTVFVGTGTSRSGLNPTVNLTRGQDLTKGGSPHRLNAIAQAALRLPEGSYVFEETLSLHEQLIWALSQYRFDKYKKLDTPIRCLCVSEEQKIHVLQWAESIFLVRDLINTPAQDMGPPELAAETRKLAKIYGAKVNVCEGAALLKEGYRAIHTVGSSAASAPQLIELGWGEASHPLVVLVGKGVTFDTGGLDLKDAAYMRIMKKDMGGAAHVLGLANWIMATRLPIRLQVLIPAVENAIGPDAYRPGDIIRMRNGLTVEVDNTDAEGRLVLADALNKACEDNPSIIIDFATLTGAARVAVGTEIAAMFTNDEAIATELALSAEQVNDPMWRLPLYAPYETMLDSSVADLLNSSPTSYAGAITAGLFLQRFVEPSIPWVHLDLMAWNLSNKPGKPEGGEAMGLRAVAHFLEQRFGR